MEIVCIKVIIIPRVRIGCGAADRSAGIIMIVVKTIEVIMKPIKQDLRRIVELVRKRRPSTLDRLASSGFERVCVDGNYHVYENDKVEVLYDPRKDRVVGRAYRKDKANREVKND